MAGVYKGLTIELGADSSALDSALRKSERQASSLQKEMKKVSKSLTFDGTDTAAYERQMRLLGQSVENAKSKVDMLRKAMANPANQGKMTDEQFSKMAYEIEVTEKQIEKYNAQMADLKARHDAANGSMSTTESRLSGLGDKLKGVGDKMQSAGKALTVGVTVPMTAAATASVKAATDIDTALTGVRKTVDGSAEDYERLKDAAIEFSKNNGVSAAQVLDIQALGAQLGFTIDELDEFSRVVAGLDIATNLDADTAATELAQFANVMGMGHDEVSNFASALIDLGNHFSTTEADVMNMAMRIAGAGASIGMTEADVLGLATALSSVGIQAEAGGTAISTIMSNIDKDVATSSENLAKWADVANMSADEFAAAWQDNALDAFTNVIAGMQDGGENLSVLLDDLGVTSLRQTDAMKRLANASELLPDAVKRANAAYEENTALAAEVANFNDSLAVKFEMVRNRVTAVAAEIGAPLADALLDLVDAGEPLFKAIEDGAQSFADMSKEEQQAVIQTVAVIAAVGPALSLFGKVATTVPALTGAIEFLSKHLGGVGTAGTAAAAGLANTATANGAVAATAAPAAAAMTALKVAAAGLAIAGIMVLASALGDYVKKQQKFTQATKGLESAVAKLEAPVGRADVGFESLGKSVRGYAGGIDEAISKQADFAKKIDDAASEYQSSAALAETYADKIKSLKSNWDGSAESVAALKMAVDGYNDATGSSIEITDAAAGELSVNTDQLDANTKAWEANARAQAAQELYAEGVKEQIKLDAEAAKAKEKLEQAEKNLQEAQASKDLGKILEAQTAYDSLNAKYKEAQRLADANREAIDKLQGQMTDYAVAAEIAKQTTDDFRAALESSTGCAFAFDDLAKSLDTDADALAKSITDAGISTQQLASIGSESFAALYTSANGDMQKVKAALDLIDAAKLEDKTVHIKDDGTVEVDKKVLDLKGDIATLDGKTIDFYANDYASNTIDALIRKINGISNSAISVAINAAGFAAGAISRVPLSAIPRHADGGMSGIVQRPTLTNIGLVGEAGAEAIIPLTNRRYVRPFAQAVAAEMSSGGQVVNNYEITLAYDASSDAAQMTRDIARNLKLLRMTEA